MHSILALALSASVASAEPESFAHSLAAAEATQTARASAQGLDLTLRPPAAVRPAEAAILEALVGFGAGSYLAGCRGDGATHSLLQAGGIGAVVIAQTLIPQAAQGAHPDRAAAMSRNAIALTAAGAGLAGISRFAGIADAAACARGGR